MEQMMKLFDQISSLIWGPPLLILLVGTGIYLTVRLGLLQVLKLPLAFKYLFDKSNNDEEGDVSSFAALCTALSATIGTGNIVGVATALKMGGPGALFWMWVAAFFGMATKYAEALLAVKYRKVDANGQMSGGPMYYIERGLGKKWLAKLFAIFGIGAACLGIGTFTQVNSITNAVKDTFHVPIAVSAIVITVLVALVTLGGLKSIAKVAERTVPFMAAFYVLGALVIILFNIPAVPGAIALVVKSAFTPTAAVGGFAGAAVMQAIRMGVARGVFSNESGLGSAPIAAAAAKTKSCVRQGLISMTGTFIDTIIICSMTGLVLIITGVWSTDLKGAEMTNAAFSAGLPTQIIGQLIVTIGLLFFAFTTILGWCYYGERCAEYLFGVKGIMPYRITYIVLVGMGGFLKLALVWTIADILNGLMALPNLIGIIGLSSVIAAETKAYFTQMQTDSFVQQKQL